MIPFLHIVALFHFESLLQGLGHARHEEIFERIHYFGLIMSLLNVLQ
jgi:hypothetical protein